MPLKVLLIDDEPLVVRALKRAFEKKGHEVFFAEDGTAGLELWRKHLPDLVFLDIWMPGLTGPQVLHKVRSEKQFQSLNAAKVILMSAFKIDDLKELKVDEFISKPFSDIFSVVEKAEGIMHADHRR